MDHQFSSEFNKIFTDCNEKGYVKNNQEYLKSFFEKTENLTMLKHSLTTKRNFAAIRIIDKLQIRIIPMMYINQHTYESIFWLNKMNMIPDSDFLEMQKKFTVMKNSEAMFRDTRRNFITQQIENSRKEHKSTRGCDKPVDLSMELNGMAFIGEAIFFIDLDEFIDIQGFSSNHKNDHANFFVDTQGLLDEFIDTQGFLDGHNRSNSDDIYGKSKYDHVADYYAKHSDETHPTLKMDKTINSLFITDNDPLCHEKKENFYAIRNLLISGKSYFHYEKLSPAQRKKISVLISVIKSLESSGTSYFLISKWSLGQVFYLIWIYCLNIKLLAVISLAGTNKIDKINVSELANFNPSNLYTFIFSRDGNIPSELLELTLKNYLGRLRR